jgi:hypothetical protein
MLLASEIDPGDVGIRENLKTLRELAGQAKCSIPSTRSLKKKLGISRGGGGAANVKQTRVPSGRVGASMIGVAELVSTAVYVCWLLGAKAPVELAKPMNLAIVALVVLGTLLLGNLSRKKRFTIALLLAGPVLAILGYVSGPLSAGVFATVSGAWWFLLRELARKWKEEGRQTLTRHGHLLSYYFLAYSGLLIVTPVAIHMHLPGLLDLLNPIWRVAAWADAGALIWLSLIMFASCSRHRE